MSGWQIESLKQALGDLLQHEAIETVYQPIYPLDPFLNGGKPVPFGFEGLSRGAAGYGIEPPERLFMVAHETGRLAEVDLLCFRKTLFRGQALSKQALLFVNLHPSTLASRIAAGDQVLSLIAASGVAPDRIVIELVEQYPVFDFDLFFQNLERVRRAGVRCALDDVGAGYSSYVMLSEVQPAFLKVNSYFTSGIQGNDVRQKVVSSIVRLGADLGSRVVCEGIERKEDLQELSRLGVELGQGFLLGLPAIAQHHEAPPVEEPPPPRAPRR